MELYARAAVLGCSKANNYLGLLFQAATMAGDEDARYLLVGMEAKSRNVEQAANHLRIAASAGHYSALITFFEKGFVS